MTLISRSVTAVTHCATLQCRYVAARRFAYRFSIASQQLPIRRLRSRLLRVWLFLQAQSFDVISFFRRDAR